MQVPFFPYNKIFSKYSDRFKSNLEKVIESGQYILGNDLAEFEKNISLRIQNKYCIGVANATDALEMMMSYHNFNKDDEIILSSHTMIATLSAIIHAGAKPVPVDINLDGTICPLEIKKNLNPKTKAIIVTQLNGHTCNMDEIMTIYHENDLILFEDSAQALGSKFKNKSAGTFGFAGCLSFYPAKILGGPGDGGAILTDNKEFFEWATTYRDHGRDLGGLKHIGRNSRLDNLMALFLDEQLKDFDSFVERRKSIAQIYTDGLNEIKALKLPELYNDSSNIHFETFQNFEILAVKRDKLKKYLREKGIGTLIQWGGLAIHNIENYRLNSKSTFDNTSKYFRDCLMLPMNTMISDNEIKYIIDTIKNFYE